MKPAPFGIFVPSGFGNFLALVFWDFFGRVYLKAPLSGLIRRGMGLESVGHWSVVGPGQSLSLGRGGVCGDLQ